MTNTDKVVYVHMRHIYNPPEDGFHEPKQNEWLKIHADYHHIEGSRYSILFPNSNIRTVADAIILGDGTIVKFIGLPTSYFGKVCSQYTIDTLENLAWDTSQTKCDDCPEWPWPELLDPETINLRIEESYGTVERMNAFFKSGDHDYDKDLLTIRQLILDRPQLSM